MLQGWRSRLQRPGAAQSWTPPTSGMRSESATWRAVRLISASKGPIAPSRLLALGAADRAYGVGPRTAGAQPLDLRATLRMLRANTEPARSAPNAMPPPQSSGFERP
jgi:hypothetical protein